MCTVRARSTCGARLYTSSYGAPYFKDILFCSVLFCSSGQHESDVSVLFCQATFNSEVHKQRVLVGAHSAAAPDIAVEVGSPRYHDVLFDDPLLRSKLQVNTHRLPQPYELRAML